MKINKKEKLNIVVGITGGIAAYKAAIFIRSLVNLGHEVVCVVTDNAYKFIGEWTLKTLTNNEVIDSVFAEKSDIATKHISLAQWCDLMVVIPATANFIAKASVGIADDALSTFNLSFSGKKIICPAMNTEMLNSPQIQNAIKTLKSYGYIFVESTSGFLACGDIGNGRLAENEDILFAVEKSQYPQDLLGKKVLINGGRTREMIDPVRFITNKSSGTMAKALCEEAVLRGATVTYIKGDIDVKDPKGVDKIISVVSADEMYEECLKLANDYDIAVLSAAVADFKPKKFEAEKIKKEKGKSISSIKLEENRDILKAMGNSKQDSSILVGFALESNSGFENGQKKLKSKNADFIVLNSLQHSQAFGDTQNRYWILDKNGQHQEIENSSKRELASQLFSTILSEK